MKSKIKSFKEKFNNISLGWKIFLYLTGFCGALLVLLWLFQVVFLSDMYESIRVKQLYKTAQNIENILLGSGNYDDVFNQAYDNEACVVIMSENGTITYSADVVKNCILHDMSYLDVLDICIKAKANGGEIYGLYSEETPYDPGNIYSSLPEKKGQSDPKSMFYCKELIDKSGSPQGYIVLNIQISPVDATVFTIRRQIYIITAIMVGFSAVLAAVISRRVSNPIKKITADAQQLATGDYETVFAGGSYREINQLSATLTKTAEELGKVESLRKDFIANVSHDLRTPLTLIGGYAEVMRDIPGENNSENAQAIIDETQRLSGLVNDLLDMSRIQSGAVPMKKEHYSLTGDIDSTIRRMGELLRNEGYRFDYSYRGDVTVYADRARISQCFYNILINAINYTGEDKTVYIRLTLENNSVTVSVTDTGDGVAQKDLPYVWERYYKNDKNHKRSVTGTGLGLSIVRSVIKAHGGSYGAYNTQDKGACFWFSIPVEGQQ